MSEFDLKITDPVSFENNQNAGGLVQHFAELSVGAGASIFKANKEGVFAGADNFADAPFKLTYGGQLTASNFILTGGEIRYGKGSFADSANAGFFIGPLGVYFGSASDAKYIKYTVSDGTFAIRGSLNADDIKAGTLIGRTIKATDGNGADVWIDSSDGKIKFLYGGSEKAYLYTLPTGSFFMDSDATLSITANDSVYITYNDDGGTDSCGWWDDDSAAMVLDSSKNLTVADDIYADNYYDYAEFFESTDQFKDGIPVGTSVVLEGDLVRPANIGEIPFGSVSGSAAIILNGGSSDAGQSWGKKYLTDDFGQKIYEDAERWILGKGKNKTKGWSDKTPSPKGAKKIIKKRQVLNPEWDSNKIFIHRKHRKEWNKIGLLGRVRLRKGQPTAPTWTKLKDISDTVEEWLIK